MPANQNMNARLEGGATASLIVIENGIMYGQDASASVANAAAKISATMRNGTGPWRRRSSAPFCFQAESRVISDLRYVFVARQYGHTA
jgi:hypothetical protein